MRTNTKGTTTTKKIKRISPKPIFVKKIRIDCASSFSKDQIIKINTSFFSYLLMTRQASITTQTPRV